MVDGIDGGPDTAPTAEPEDTRELRMVLGLTLAGQSVREIAIALYGSNSCGQLSLALPWIQTWLAHTSRPAALCRQLRCASHHQAPHTGRLSAIA